MGIDKKLLISFIVSVYNLESYIGACLDSILAQPFDDYEIVLVNNNSADSSGAICEKYAERCDKIRYFALTGEPFIGRAAIVGAGAARGEYLQYIDGDDMLSPGVYGEVAAILRKERPDVLFGQFSTVMDENVLNFTDRSFDAARTNGKGKQQALEYLTEEQPFILALWRLIVSSRLRAPFSLAPAPIENSTNIHQDVYISVRALVAASSLYYMDTPLYQYRVRASSTSRMNVSKQVFECCEMLLNLAQLLCHEAKTEQERAFVGIYMEQFHYQVSAALCATDAGAIRNGFAAARLFEASPDATTNAAWPDIQRRFPLVGAMLSSGELAGIISHQAYCLDIIRRLAAAITAKIGPVFLAPTGNIGLYLKAALKAQGVAVSGFFDNDRQKDGMEADGVLVCPPDAIGELTGDAVPTVLIASRYRNVRNELKSQFASLGVRESDIITIEF